MSTSNQKPNLAQVRKEAHQLLDLGYTPLPAVPHKKRPPFKWKKYQETPPTHQELDMLFDKFPEATGLGIVTSGLVIIDVDTLKDGSRNPFLDEPECCEALATTFVVKSAGNGYHLYYRNSDELKVKNSVGKIAKRVDVRASGGFLIVPPTKRDGNPYEWLNGKILDIGPQELATLPQDIVLLLKAKAASKWKGPVPVEGPILDGARDDTLFRLASKWRGHGHTFPELQLLLDHHNSTRCVPPLEESDLKKIAKSTLRFEPNDTGEPAINYPDPGPMPDRLFDVPGFISSVMDLTLSTAPFPNKPLAFAGALALQATLAGRKVSTESDLRTNFYLITLGSSGIGKDHPRKVNSAILFDATLDNALVGSIASGQALEDEVHRNPAVLAQIDEVDEVLMSIRRDKTGTRQNLPKVLMELFTSASSKYRLRLKASQERRVVDQPNLSILCSAVPRRFYEAVSVRMLSDGFLGRSLIIEASKRSRRHQAQRISIPEAISEVTRFWISNKFQPEWNSERPEPRTVATSKEGAMILEKAAERFDEERTAAEDEGDEAATSIWARTYEHTEKLALIYAISKDHQNPSIDASAAKWAMEFMDHHTRRLLATVAGQVPDSEFHALQIKVKNKIRSCKRETISHSRLMNHLHIKARDLNEVIDSLEQSGEIEILEGAPDSISGKGKYYRLREE